MCLLVDTHTLSSGSRPVLWAVNVIAVLYVCVAVGLNSVHRLSSVVLFFAVATQRAIGVKPTTTSLKKSTPDTTFQAPTQVMKRPKTSQLQAH